MKRGTGTSSPSSRIQLISGALSLQQELHYLYFQKQFRRTLILMNHRYCNIFCTGCALVQVSLTYHPNLCDNCSLFSLVEICIWGMPGLEADGEDGENGNLLFTSKTNVHLQFAYFSEKFFLWLQLLLVHTLNLHWIIFFPQNSSLICK